MFIFYAECKGLIFSSEGAGVFVQSAGDWVMRPSLTPRQLRHLNREGVKGERGFAWWEGVVSRVSS